MRSGFATKKDADQALAEFLVQAGRGSLPAVGRQSLAEYLDGWLVGVRLSLAATAFCLVPGLMEGLNSRGACCSYEVVTAVQGLELDRRDEPELAV